MHIRQIAYIHDFEANAGIARHTPLKKPSDHLHRTQVVCRKHRAEYGTRQNCRQRGGAVVVFHKLPSSTLGKRLGLPVGAEPTIIGIRPEGLVAYTIFAVQWRAGGGTRRCHYYALDPPFSRSTQNPQRALAGGKDQRIKGFGGLRTKA